MTGDAVAVVVCTRDRPHLLDGLLAAAMSSVRPGDELVVVDSASVKSSAVDAARANGVRVVRCNEPGASRARNAGAAATAAPILAFTDDDCLPEPGWVDAVAAAFAGDPGLGFLTGRVTADNDGSAVSVITDVEARPLTDPDGVIDMGHGANLAVRRVAFDAIDGFDVELGAGAPLRACEDKDLLWRLLRAGWVGRYEPKAVVVHRQWRDRDQLLRLEFSYGMGGGAFSSKVVRSGGGTKLLRRDVGTALGYALRGRRWSASSVGLRVAGAYAGAARALGYRIRDGHLVRRGGQARPR
jgi:glycosyltransferase involved in cell wall biosynthesis